MILKRPCAEKKIRGIFMPFARESMLPLTRKGKRKAIQVAGILFIMVNMIGCDYAYANEINDRLISAIIQVESGWNPTVEGIRSFIYWN